MQEPADQLAKEERQQFMALGQERSQREMETRERARERPVAKERIVPCMRGAPAVDKTNVPPKDTSARSRQWKYLWLMSGSREVRKYPPAAELHLIPTNKLH